MKPVVYLIQTPPFWLKTPPLSLIYLKTFLENKGIATGIVDLNMLLFKTMQTPLRQWLRLDEDFEHNLFEVACQRHPEVFNRLYEQISQARYVGLSLLRRNTSFSFSLAKEICKRFPNKKIIFGGPHTLWLDKNSGFDNKYYWVVGEGESALARIINGEKIKIYRFQEIADLDSLPLYDFGPLKTDLYSASLPLLSSRGCPYCCGFCSERLLYRKFRHHSPQYMLDQIQLLKKKYAINSFVFLDSLINYSNDWLYTFCGLLIEKNLNINWEAQMRIQDNFPLELAKAMKQSGCYNLFVGLESASDTVLAAMNKGFKASSAVSFLKTLKAADLHFELSLIFGHPAESEKEFNETVNFIVGNKNIIPKIAQVNPYIDYFSDTATSDSQRVKSFLRIIEREKIRYTKSFINNLIY